MKQIKPIFNIIIVFLFLAQNSFALSKPIPGVGIVVKKNPGGGSIVVPTGTGGGFSIKLEEGEYVLLFLQDQLQKSINGIIKTDYPKSNYQYNGSGVEMVLENSAIRVNIKALQGNRFTIDKQNSFTIIVPKGGATLSGKLSWDDAVMTHSKTCPNGFMMQNGECVSSNNSGNQQLRTEGKTKGKVKDLGPKSPMITVENSNNNNNPSLNVSLNANGGTSSSNGVSNSFSFNPNLGLELKWNHFGIGLDVGTFNTKPNFDFDNYAAPLQNLDFLTVTNTKNNWTNTYFMFGPQYTVHLSGRHSPFHNKLTFTLALKGGLTLNKAPEFSVIDNSTPPKTVASYEAPQDYKKNVFSLKPSISFAYWINENIALTANAQYLMQTGQEEFTIGYRDLSAVNFNLNPQKVKSQILAAPQVASTTKGPDKYMSFGFGITYSFRKGWDGSIKGNKKVETISIKNQRKGITEGGLKKNNVETTSDETQRKGIKENGLKKNDAETTTFDGVDTKATGENPTSQKGWDGSIKGNKTVETINNENQRKGIKEQGLKKNDAETTTVDGVDTKATGVNPTSKKGWDGSIKGNKTVETINDENERKGIRENGLKKNDVQTTNGENQRKGIKEQGLKKNDAETTTFDGVDTKATGVNPTSKKGWDGSIKGNKSRLKQKLDKINRKGIKENGLK